MEIDDKNSDKDNVNNNKIKQPEKSIAKNSIFFLIYNVLNVIFPFVTGIYVARILLPESIGQVAYAQNIAQYFVILAFWVFRHMDLGKFQKQEKTKKI